MDFYCLDTYTPRTVRLGSLNGNQLTDETRLYDEFNDLLARRCNYPS